MWYIGGGGLSCIDWHYNTYATPRSTQNTPHTKYTKAHPTQSTPHTKHTPHKAHPTQNTPHTKHTPHKIHPTQNTSHTKHPPTSHSNGEYLQFVKAGGYRQEGWWSTEGWHWRTFRNAKWPTFWVLDGPAGVCMCVYVLFCWVYVHVFFTTIFTPTPPSPPPPTLPKVSINTNYACCLKRSPSPMPSLWWSTIMKQKHTVRGSQRN